MFIHLGRDTLVYQQQIIAIIDLDTIADSPATREYIELAEVEGRIVRVDDDGKAKSAIITDCATYLSPISSVTLMKRAHFVAQLPGA
jgi:hypothetical protein